MQSCIQAGYKSIKCPLGIVGGFPGGSAGKELPCNSRDLSSVPGLGRCPGEGNSYPLQYSGLENSTDCIVHGVTKSWARLIDFHFQIIRSVGFPGSSDSKESACNAGDLG